MLNILKNQQLVGAPNHGLEQGSSGWNGRGWQLHPDVTLVVTSSVRWTIVGDERDPFTGKGFLSAEGERNSGCVKGEGSSSRRRPDSEVHSQ